MSSTPASVWGLDFWRRFRSFDPFEDFNGSFARIRHTSLLRLQLSAACCLSGVAWQCRDDRDIAAALECFVGRLERGGIGPGEWRATVLAIRQLVLEHGTDPERVQMRCIPLDA